MESITPQRCISVHAIDGYETYKIDDHTIGVRPIWISVEDRLPIENIKVLIYTNHGVFMDYISYPKDGNIWTLNDKNIITHWMSLPKPPKE